MSLAERTRKYGDAADSQAAVLGARVTRFDGPAKIRGTAAYALEHHPENLAHAVLVPSRIAAGRVRHIDKSAAESAPGVLLVLTPDTILVVNAASDWMGNPPTTDSYNPLATEITFSGEPIAAIVAETLEEATEAARLLVVDYDERPSLAELPDDTGAD